MNRRALLASFGRGLPVAKRALADLSSGTRRIGVFAANDSCEAVRKSATPWFKGLAKLGHVEGRNLAVEWHCFQGDLARRKVDVL